MHDATTEYIYTKRQMSNGIDALSLYSEKFYGGRSPRYLSQFLPASNNVSEYKNYSMYYLATKAWHYNQLVAT